MQGAKGRRGRPATPEQARRREELLRPNRFLGYDHDSLGVHLLRIGALELAEGELRRAVWLNPYESRFRLHLAWCLMRAHSYHEAKEKVSEVLVTCPQDDESLKLLALIDEKLSPELSDDPRGERG
jgi:Flp pilus assembly protein TadD